MHTLADLYHRVSNGQWKGRIGLSSQTDQMECAELGKRVDAVRESLAADVRHGDIALVKVSASISSVADLLGLWSLGAVVVPLKSAMDERAVSGIAQDCNARFIVESGDISTLESYIEPRQRFVTCRTQRVSGSDQALIIYTSGSTGTPKGIMLSHNNVMTALRSIADYLQIDTRERILNISPLSFDYGLYQVLFALYCDCSVVLYDENVNPITLVKAIERHEITLLPALPVIAIMLEKGAALSRKTLSSLRKLTNTGGHLSESTIDALCRRFPELQIFAMYGLTESKRALYLPPEDLHRKKGSVGIPMPGLEAKVFLRTHADAGQDVYEEAPAGEVGTLFVRGPSVMQGYTRNDSGAGAQIHSGAYRDDNWLDTGDLFLQDEEGYFYFKGRQKELIKQGGFCLYATDIEEAVIAHPAIEFASVVGTNDRTGAEIACLFIKPHIDHPATQKEILAWIKTNLDADYCPRMIRFIENVSLSVNGKIDKKQLLADHL